MLTAPAHHSDRTFERYRAKRQRRWDERARRGDGLAHLGGYYRAQVRKIYGRLIPPGSQVLEIGCGLGDLLASLKPSEGVGIDFSAEMVERAQQRHPDLYFVRAEAHEFELRRTFDYIILSDTVNDVWDVQKALERAARHARPDTRIILNFHSRLWALPLAAAEHLGLKRRNLPQNWLTAADLSGLLRLAGFELIRHWSEFLRPLGIPLLARFCNQYLVRFKPFAWMALTNFLIARPKPRPRTEEPTVSVIVPARNEAGNISQILDRVPEMGGGTEIIFVEGNSTDNTYEAIEEALAQQPARDARLLKQPGKGKGDAVRAGFAAARGDILMILDADLTVPPETLPNFYRALRDGQAEFVNGVRLVYPMADKAMRFFNLLGNKFFSWSFTWLLGQPIKDTLCGTKVLWRKDYERIAANRAYFGDFDPFGDFDLLFGAAKLNLAILDLPVRYRERTYGTTNISRWKHGLVLLRMVAFAARRLKFV